MVGITHGSPNVVDDDDQRQGEERKREKESDSIRDILKFKGSGLFLHQNDIQLRNRLIFAIKDMPPRNLIGYKFPIQI
ncbi:hypothetical protein T12_17002 [Trichinella patagoniensis]|uniref:Uncharacterized protein n=1 Tax=Trichinella patagoniensis TaxID=990121 RepID=A0A0V0ZQ58_9BILA|nr:hypothetical protein T12_17002 [Trichinella patagoniensis]